MAHKYVLDVDVALNRNLYELFHELGECSAFAELGEGVSKLPDTPPPSAEAFVRFIWGKSHAQGTLPTPWETVGPKFAAYCGRYALLGMVTATEVFLGRLWLLTKLIRAVHKAGGSIRTEEYERLVKRERGRVEATALPRRLSGIMADIQVEPPSVRDDIDCISGIYNMRVCVSHRGGIVGKEDAPGGSLKVEWRRLVLEVDSVPLQRLGAVIPAGSKLGVVLRAETRIWSVGQSIELTAADINNIAATLASACTRLRNTVKARAVDWLRRG